MFGCLYIFLPDNTPKKIAVDPVWLKSTKDTQQEQLTNTDEIDLDVGESLTQINQITPQNLRFNRKIENLLLNTVVKPLKKYAFQQKSKKNTNDILNISITLALVKVCKFFTLKNQEQEISTLIQVVCTYLSNRNQKIRESAIYTIIKITQSLGSGSFEFVFSQLKSYLTRGYQLHVLSYTLYHLLHSLASTLKPGTIDPCLADLYNILYEDIFGQVAEQKSVGQIKSKTKEAKSNFGTSNYRYIAMLIDLNNNKSLEELFSPIIRIALAARDKKRIDKINAMLTEISKGLLSNTTMEIANFFPYILKMLKDHFYVKKVTSQNSTTVNEALKAKDSLLIPPTPSQRKVLTAEPIKVSNNHLILSFVLNFMAHILPKVYKILQEQKALVKEIIKLTTGCLSEDNNSVILNALKVLSKLVTWNDFPSINDNNWDFVSNCFNLIQGSNPQSNLTAECFQIITISLNSRSDIIKPMLLREDMSTLLQFVRTNLVEFEESPNQSVSFKLLESLIDRKIVLTELYDIMNDLTQLIVLSSKVEIRTKASKLFVKFVEYYPLGENRLEQYFNFVVLHLTHPQSGVRESILKLLTMFFTQLEKMILPRYQFFFLPLVTALINDEDPNCKASVAKTLKSLLSLYNPSMIKKLIKLIGSWFENPTPNSLLQLSGVQIIGLVLEVFPNEIRKYLTRLFNLLLNTLSESDNDNWQIIYQTLITLEKFIKKIPTVIKNNEFNTIVQSIVNYDLLLHERPWIRQASSRLLGKFFTVIAKSDYNDFPKWVQQHSTLIKISKSSCYQLENQHLTMESGLQITKNLTFLTKLFFNYPELDKFETASPQDLEDENMGTTESTQGVEPLDTVNETESTTKKSQPSYWIFKKFSIFGLKCVHKPASQLQLKIIIQWFMYMLEFIPEDQLNQFINLILRPIYRCIHQNQAHIQDQSVKENIKLSKELVRIMKQRVPVSQFVKLYSFVQQSFEKKSNTRKRKLALLSVVNPEKRAILKKQAYTRRRAAKKRKAIEDSDKSIYGPISSNYYKRKKRMRGKK